MPLPLGHLAIGLAAHELGSDRSAFGRWKLFAAILALSNLPDIDVVFGLVLQWNGCAFHRGPTHSLVFTLAAGLAASMVSARARHDRLINRLAIVHKLSFRRKPESSRAAGPSA
jgi:inner membrane protein